MKDPSVSQHPLFQNRVGILATMHHKEKVMAPLLEQLGVKIQVPPHFNTDRFGTFTREVDRPGNQLEAARSKAEQALALTGESLAFASEGTFGPHPFIPTIALNRELVLMLDQKHGLELVGESVSTETNFAHQQITSLAEAQLFAKQVGFPTHGLVVMPSGGKNPAEQIFKGITSESQLIEAVTLTLARSGSAHLETDMRALYNPTRMKNIASATEKLIQKLLQTCPQCDWPGYDVIKRRAGLPCELCGFPTQSLRSLLYQCQQCQWSEEKLFPEGRETADPTYCAYCNP